jgi:hypothetical protein
MKLRKVGLLILALVIALGTLGVGYAKWSDTVAINGSVRSGNLCMQWFRGNNLDPLTPPTLDPKYDPDSFMQQYWDKNVAYTTVSLSSDKKIVDVTVTDAYPGYFNDLEMEYINCGSIPFKVQNFSIIPDPDYPFTIDPTPDWTNNDPDGEIWIDWSTTGIGYQVHPGQRGTSSFNFIITQAATQGATYKFTIAIEGVQWNEYTP